MKKIITSKTCAENRNSILSFFSHMVINRLIILLLMIFSSYSLSAQYDKELNIPKVSKNTSTDPKCSFNLNVKNNIESVNNDGRIYFIEMLNNSNEEMEINLSILNNNSGMNPDETNSKDNVNLTSIFIYEDGQEIKGNVKLKSRELLTFQVKVSVPSGTPSGHWNHILIRATSNRCEEYSNSLTLFTFIPNPEEK